MLRGRAAKFQELAKLAKRLAGDNAPEWLAHLLLEFLDGLVVNRAVERVIPTRRELQSTLDKLRDAVDLIVDEMHSLTVRDLFDAPGPAVISDIELGKVLLDLGRRIERARNSDVLADAAGRLKRGRSRARLPSRLPPEIVCTLIIVETWRHFGGKDLGVVGNSEAAAVAESYWRLAGGDAHEVGEVPLACWKPRFREALQASAEPERQGALEELRSEMRRRLDASGGAGSTLTTEVERVR